MGFDSGTMSFARYAVIGQGPKAFGESHLDKLRDNAFKSIENGIPCEVEYAWAGPGHIYDDAFTFEHCVFNDCLHFAMRVDTNRVPADVKRAYIAQKEAAMAAQNPSGFISKVQRQMVRDEVSIMLEDDIRAGKHRRSKGYPIMWDATTSIVYAPAATSVKEKLCEIFQRTFGLELQILTSGHTFQRIAEWAGHGRDFDDWTPTRFTRSQNDPDAPATYPWSVRGDGAKDYLGNEFLMWLWYTAANDEGSIEIDTGPTIVVMFSRSLAMDCCFAESGKTGLTSFGPTRMPEAMDAARSGKVPRKASLIIETGGEQFSFTLGGKSLSVSGLKLPDIDDADTERGLFEERINLLRSFDVAMKHLYRQYLRKRTTEWAGTTQRIRNWIAKDSAKASVTSKLVEA